MADLISSRSRSMTERSRRPLLAALMDARRMARAAISLLLVFGIFLLPHARLGHASNAVDALAHDLAIICAASSGPASNPDAGAEAPTALPEAGDRAHCPLCLGGAAPPPYEPTTVAPVRWATLLAPSFSSAPLRPIPSGAGVPGRPRAPPQPF